ncbi:hypothetical protein [Neptunomonas concharum]|uniref:ABM domain-containing protein n=1 Tax=Neptunomonas concharum TaxID=1031538 RepID=A0A5P1R9Q8_9GAMM|nr:hypothetical protein [Neptunomonas concharum]QEQ96327.1 hypothetical protein F0U83_06180 [Neptunomonas concharum]
MQPPIFEILTWKSAPNVTEKNMIDSMSRFGNLVSTLPGFLHQSLYKRRDETWVCVYFWETEQQAHDSNDLVAGTPEFSELISLIEEGSITMEVLTALQERGIIA